MQVIIIIFIISASHYSRSENIDIHVYMSAIRKREEYAWCLFMVNMHYLNCDYYRWMFTGRMIKAEKEQK